MAFPAQPMMTETEGLAYAVPACSAAVAPDPADRPQAVADSSAAQDAVSLAALGAALARSGLLRAVVASLGRGRSAHPVLSIPPLRSDHAFPALCLPGLYGAGAGGGGPGRIVFAA